MFYEFFQLCENLASYFMQLTKITTTILNTNIPILDIKVIEIITGVGFPAYLSVLFVKWLGDAIPG